MLLHFHVVEVVQQELRHLADNDGVVLSEKWFLSFDGHVRLQECCREQVPSNKNVLKENLLKLLIV